MKQSKYIMGAPVKFKALLRNVTNNTHGSIAERLSEFVSFKRKKTFNQLHKVKMLYPQGWGTGILNEHNFPSSCSVNIFVYVLCLCIVFVMPVSIWVYDGAFSLNWAKIYKKRQYKYLRLVQRNYPFILWLVNCNFFSVKAKDRLVRCCHEQFTSWTRTFLKLLALC